MLNLPTLCTRVAASATLRSLKSTTARKPLYLFIRHEITSPSFRSPHVLRATYSTSGSRANYSRDVALGSTRTVSTRTAIPYVLRVVTHRNIAKTPSYSVRHDRMSRMSISCPSIFVVIFQWNALQQRFERDLYSSVFSSGL